MSAVLENMSARGGILAIAASALATHWIFNRREPTALRVLFIFLFLVPATLSSVLFQHYGAISGVALSFLVYYTTLSTSIVIYRISPFHPLARYPGPFLAKVSRWWWTLVALRGYQHIVLQQLHDKYGDSVRIGPNEMSFSDISVVEPMMGAQGLPKGPTWEGRTLVPPVLPLVALRDNESHTRRRKPWNRAFSIAALKNYEPVIANRASQFVELLAEKKQVDFTRSVNLFTFDFMTDSLFGGGSNIMADDDKDGLVHAVVSGFIDAQIFEHLPWMAHIARALPGIAKSTKAFRAMLMSRGIERWEKGSTRKDLFYWLSNEDGSEKENPDRATVIAESGLAIIAGSDTTAAVMANVVYCLCAYPEAYKRLQAEVDHFYPPGEDSLDAQHIHKMPYLTAIINEAMRVYPVVPNGSQRAPERGSGGFAAGEHFIPEWTNIRVPAWTVQRHSRYFSRPEEFFPDRWLIADGLQKYDGELKHTPDAFFPFSAGPRNCVAKNLALLEMKMLLTHMTAKLQLRFQDGFDPSITKWTEIMQDRFNLCVGELPIVIERRA